MEVGAGTGPEALSCFEEPAGEVEVEKGGGEDEPDEAAAILLEPQPNKVRMPSQGPPDSSRRL